MSIADRDLKKISLYLLSGLTALDLLVWVFNQQIALFSALFFLIPLWAVWIWKFIPPEDNDIFPEMEGEKREDHH